MRMRPHKPCPTLVVAALGVDTLAPFSTPSGRETPPAARSRSQSALPRSSPALTPRPPQVNWMAAQPGEKGQPGTCSLGHFFPRAKGLGFMSHVIFPDISSSASPSSQHPTG